MLDCITKVIRLVNPLCDSDVTARGVRPPRPRRRSAIELRSTSRQSCCPLCCPHVTGELKINVLLWLRQNNNLSCQKQHSPFPVLHSLTCFGILKPTNPAHTGEVCSRSAFRTSCVQFDTIQTPILLFRDDCLGGAFVQYTIQRRARRAQSISVGGGPNEEKRPRQRD
jgi:hypothetical protein